MVNRLFRLPMLLQEPGGVGSDLWTNAGLLTGFRPASLQAALALADKAQMEARRLDVPLIATGQSQAGGTAQLQVAHVLAADSQALAGFVTFNATCRAVSICHVGLDPARLPGVNFSKDLDPLVGPHSGVANEIGLQIYIHADGTAGLKPRGSYAKAALHPREHFLDSFNGLSLGKLLAQIRGYEGAKRLTTEHDCNRNRRLGTPKNRCRTGSTRYRRGEASGKREAEET